MLFNDKYIYSLIPTHNKGIFSRNKILKLTKHHDNNHLTSAFRVTGVEPGPCGDLSVGVTPGAGRGAGIAVTAHVKGLPGYYVALNYDKKQYR